MNFRIKFLVGLSLLGVACSTGTTTVDPTHQDVGDDDDDKDDAGTTGEDSGATTPNPTTPDAAAKADAAPTQLSCPLSFENATCEACFARSCATQCGTCAGDSACDAALSCIAACTTDACDTACLEGVPASSLALLDATIGNDGCFGTTCAAACAAPVSPTAKVGDPCTTSAQCISNFCNGSWCEPATECFENTECGIDSEGELVWCAPASASLNGCYPGCSTNADCDLYPGTFCQATTATNGATAYVCGS